MCRHTHGAAMSCQLSLAITPVLSLGVQALSVATLFCSNVAARPWLQTRNRVGVVEVSLKISEWLQAARYSKATNWLFGLGQTGISQPGCLAAIMFPELTALSGNTPPVRRNGTRLNMRRKILTTQGPLDLTCV